MHGLGVFYKFQRDIRTTARTCQGLRAGVWRRSAKKCVYSAMPKKQLLGSRPTYTSFQSANQTLNYFTSLEYCLCLDSVRLSSE